MLTQLQISDQIEIAQTLNRYFQAIDSKHWELLDSVFAPAARVHYVTVAEIDTTYEKMLPIFALFMDSFAYTQHCASQMVIHVDGDAARSTCCLRALHIQETHAGEPNAWVVYGNYSDELSRTAYSWRICQRSFRSLHTEGELLPGDRVKSFPVPRHLVAAP